jgi:hypothetical protein
MFAGGKKGKEYQKKEDLEKAYDELLNQKEVLEEKVTESQTKTDTVVASNAYEVNNFAIGITDAANVGKILESAFKGVAQNFNPKNLQLDIEALTKQAQELGNNMGIGSARAGEFRSMIANAVPDMVRLGMTEQEALKVFESVPKSLGVNTTLAKETVVELGAASKFSSIDAGTLANKFKSVGFNLDQVGNKMADVANYAKGVGVNVNAVTKGVVENLGKLNTMNFEGGVKGLTKMVAQSEMLGGFMGEVLQKAEGIMDPEKAIEFSSALQRLGVQSSALLDPLSAMDMALNDPAALQNEMVKISQQFTRLKADGSGFEILPGAKLQMKEIAGTLGLSADKLAEMALKSSDLELKMSKIRFPGFAASEEDKQLIANMSQMKDGKAVVQIKDEAGQMKEVDVENLTAEQLEALKKDQADQNKTAEELARDQLSVLEQINQNIKGAQGAMRMGIASSGPLQRMTDASYKIQEATTRGFGEQVTTEGVRNFAAGTMGDVEKGIVNLATGEINLENLKSALGEFANIPSKILDGIEKAAGGIKAGAIKAYVEGSYGVQETYSEVSGKKPEKPTVENSTVIQGVEDLTNKIKEGYSNVKQFLGIETKTDVNVNVKTDQNVGNMTDQQKSTITDEIVKWFSDNNNITSVYNKMLEVNKGDMPSKP